MDAASKDEFWWLNNGVTLLAEECPITGNKIKILKPEIVNGLQTSHEVYEAFKNNRQRIDTRKILLRVIVAPEERTRNKIIKATNSQTPVSQFSLKATDRIHFDIEDKLTLYGLYYDRRKGENKRCKKPVSKIISIPALSQAVIAALLQRPSDARGRPQTLLNRQDTYDQIFNDNCNRDVYAACILLDRQVLAYLERSQLARDEKRDIRFYLLMLMACELTKTANPNLNQIAAIVKECNQPIDEATLDKYRDICLKAYKDEGGNDKAAKSPALQTKVITLAQSLFPN
jgi:hypothetical protein